VLVHCIGVNPGGIGVMTPDFGMGIFGFVGFHEILSYPMMYRNMR